MSHHFQDTILSGFWFLVKSSSVINYTGVVGKLRDRIAALNI